MTVLTVPINIGQSRTVDADGIGPYNALLYDGYVNLAGEIWKRPGLTEFCDLEVSSGIDGLYYWSTQSKLIAVCDGDVYSITSAGVDTDLGGDDLESGNPVYFADFGSTLYAANGGQILSIPASGAPSYIADADAPTTVTAISEIDTYLIALKASTEQVWYSQGGDPTDWQGLFFSEQYKPDIARMIGVKDGIIEVFGSQSIAGWWNDGSTPFIRDSQYTVDHGILQPHTLVYCNDLNGNGNWYWLSTDKQIVKMVNRQVVPIAPASLSNYIRSFSTHHAVSGECLINGQPHYIINFYNEGRTIAVNITTETWSEFGKWNSGTSLHGAWLCQCYEYASDWNKQFLGDATSGKIYTSDPSVYTDDSDTLCTRIRTDNIDRGSVTEKKFPRQLRFHLKKADGDDFWGDITLYVKWRDNGSLTWKTTREVTLSYTAGMPYRGKIINPGSYYSRQYEIWVTDDEPFILVKVEEEF